MIIKCADCGCNPQDCRNRNCHECSLDVCCCLVTNN